MKPQLLETTRLFLAVERAADLGELGIELGELAHEFGLGVDVLRQFLAALDDTADRTASPDELIDWTLDEDERLRVYYAPGLDKEIPLGGDEAIALMIGLDRLGLSPERQADLGAQLLARLSAAEAERLLGIRHRLMVKAQHRWRSELDAALESGSGLRILYESASGRQWRRIAPSATVDYDGQLYIGAWCFERQAPRLFRGDRLFQLEPYELHEPAGPSLDQQGLRQRLAELTDGQLNERIVLRCADEDGRWMVEDYLGPKVRWGKGGVITFHDFAGQALVNWIVSCTGSVVVESPPRLAQRVTERAREVLVALVGESDG